MAIAADMEGCRAEHASAFVEDAGGDGALVRIGAEHVRRLRNDQLRGGLASAHRVSPCGVVGWGGPVDTSPLRDQRSYQVRSVPKVRVEGDTSERRHPSGSRFQVSQPWTRPSTVRSRRSVPADPSQHGDFMVG